MIWTATAPRRMPVPGSRRPAALCDHKGVPRGTAARWKTRYSVRLTVPRRDGWRAWGAVRGDFERALSDAGDPAICAAEIASEHRRGADYVRVTVALTVTALDVSDALAIGWDAFTSAAGDGLAGWKISGAAAEVQPGPPLPGADVRLPGSCGIIRGQNASARGPGHRLPSGGQPGRIARPVAGREPGGDLPGLAAADRGDVIAAAAGWLPRLAPSRRPASPGSGRHLWRD